MFDRGGYCVESDHLDTAAMDHANDANEVAVPMMRGYGIRTHPHCSIRNSGAIDTTITTT